MNEVSEMSRQSRCAACFRAAQIEMCGNLDEVM
jgi:hypothetical protein